MKLESQVVSMKLSKELFDLNVPQESCFYWMAKSKQLAKKKPVNIGTGVYSAFTVAELGELLPDWNDMLYFPKKLKGEWGGLVGTLEVIKADTEANARAKILIYLIENKLIKL